MARRCGASQAMRPVSEPWAVRKPWETAVPVAQANRQRANLWGRRKALPMSRRTRGFPPARPLARRIACPISMGHYQGPLALVGRCPLSCRYTKIVQMAKTRVLATVPTSHQLQVRSRPERRVEARAIARSYWTFIKYHRVVDNAKWKVAPGSTPCGDAGMDQIVELAEHQPSGPNSATSFNLGFRSPNQFHNTRRWLYDVPVEAGIAPGSQSCYHSRHVGGVIRGISGKARPASSTGRPPSWTTSAS